MGTPSLRRKAGIIRVNTFGLFRVRGLFLPRVRFVWIPEQLACVSSNVDGVKLTLIVTLITDFLLLVTVLAGLFRIRRCGGGSFGLEDLLWKQVQWMAAPSTSTPLGSSMCFC
jgi:hypothetical protein